MKKLVLGMVIASMCIVNGCSVSLNPANSSVTTASLEKEKSQDASITAPAKIAVDTLEGQVTAGQKHQKIGDFYITGDVQDVIQIDILFDTKDLALYTNFQIIVDSNKQFADTIERSPTHYFSVKTSAFDWGKDIEGHFIEVFADVDATATNSFQMALEEFIKSNGQRSPIRAQNTWSGPARDIVRVM